MRGLIKRLILWALANGSTSAPNDAAALDALAKSIQTGS